jgi:hypothetical protein
MKYSLKTLYWAASGDAPLGQWLAPKQGDAGILDGQTPPAGELTWLSDVDVATCAAALALQLPFLKVSESMGNHDSKIVDAGSVD